LSSTLLLSTFSLLLSAFCLCVDQFQDVVDGIEFARGGPKTPWGSVRAAMGHPEPFKLDYVSIGNQECWMLYYRGLSFSYMPTCITHELT
jgi:alpha-L-arabinofuranosidase